jgi:Trypsin
MKLVSWLVAIALVSLAPNALCVTNATVDNNLHPNVGTIVAEYLTPGVKDQACTGVLISSTVFLTAGHCVAILEEVFNVTQVWVTFDTVFTPSATLYSGTMHLNPAFPGQGASDPEDLGVIVLDSPVQGISPAALPSLGLLDRMSADGSLKDTLFTIVGYGATNTVFGGGPPDPNQGKGTRRYATEGFAALNPDLLRLSQNAVFGYGGSNHGDSGSPNFVGAGNSETSIVAAITSSGDTWGISQNVAYRLDTPEARAFLGQFVILP